MRQRDSAVQGLAVGAGAAAVGAAGMTLIKFGADQEAVLSFLGALFGAAATVAGAAWLSDRNAHAEQRAETDLLAEEIQIIHDLAAHALAQKPAVDGPWPEAYRSAIHALDMPLREIHSIIVEALDHGKRLTFRQRTRLRQMEAAAQGAWRFYSDCYLTDEELHPLDERTWEGTLENIISVSNRALSEIRRTG